LQKFVGVFVMGTAVKMPRPAVVRVFAPGDDAAGCVVVGDRVVADSPTAAVRVACPCGAAFPTTAAEIVRADRARLSLKCPGCRPPAAPPPPGAPPYRMTARDYVVLAAHDLMATGQREFTEWDLAVATWALNRKLFGMRGYEQSYPDTKRVGMELVKTRTGSVVNVGHLDRVRPNTYRLTPVGVLEATRIRAAVNRGA
jgi:hypothetical protein